MLIVSCCSVLRGEGPPHHLDEDDEPLTTEQQATQDEMWDEVVSGIFECDPPDEDADVDCDDVDAMEATLVPPSVLDSCSRSGGGCGGGVVVVGGGSSSRSNSSSSGGVGGGYKS